MSGRSWASRGAASPVGAADELQQHLGAEDLHRVRDGHAQLPYSRHSAPNSAAAHWPAMASLPNAVRLAMARLTRDSLTRRPSR